MRTAKMAGAWMVISMLLTIGCRERLGMARLIPASEAAPARQAELARIIDSVALTTPRQRNEFSAGKESEIVKVGKEITPFVIRRIVRVLEAGPQKVGAFQLSYPGANVLIRTLGRIKDERAVPVLNYWVTEEKWRILRADAAWALGRIRSPESVSALWNAWNQEIRYLAAGDTRGPSSHAWYDFPKGSVYGELAALAVALDRVGEEKILEKLKQLIESEGGADPKDRGQTLVFFSLREALSTIERRRWTEDGPSFVDDWWQEGEKAFD